MSGNHSNLKPQEYKSMVKHAIRHDIASRLVHGRDVMSPLPPHVPSNAATLNTQQLRQVEALQQQNQLLGQMVNRSHPPIR